MDFKLREIMGFEIRQASRRQARLRIALSGHSGSGKTYSALLIAKGLCDGDLSKVVLIDTESGRAELYSNLGPYNVLRLASPFSPARYIDAINAAVSFGAEVIIIDSVSHEWEGEGGCLSMQKIEAQKPGKNSYTAWDAVTPQHNRFINTIINCPAHVISTVRTKTGYELEEYQHNGRTKTKPVKIGLANVQREGFDYEQTLDLRMYDNHYAVVMKDNTGLFAGNEFIPSVETGEQLRAWVNEGEPVSPEMFALRDEFYALLQNLPVAQRSPYETAMNDAFNANNMERMNKGLASLRGKVQPEEKPEPAFAGNPKPVQPVAEPPITQKGDNE